MRLTRFNNLTKEYEYHLNNPNTSMVQDEIAGIQKLGQLEDILEKYDMDNIKKLSIHLELLRELTNIKNELGIDLVVFLKVLIKRRVYVKEIDKEIDVLGFADYTFNTLVFENYRQLSFKDYGKTWALTKEELE